MPLSGGFAEMNARKRDGWKGRREHEAALASVAFASVAFASVAFVSAAVASPERGLGEECPNHDVAREAEDPDRGAHGRWPRCVSLT